MRTSEIREMTPEERRARLDDLKEEYRGLRFGHVMQQVSNPLELRQVRRDIARLKTIIHEDEMQAQAQPEAGETAEAVEGEEA